MPSQEVPVIEDLDMLRHVEIGDVPRLDEFQIQLVRNHSRSGLVLFFTGENETVVAEFPWWDGVEEDIAHWRLADIPCGTVDAPFLDRDQGWSIVIWKVEDFVIFAEGEGNDEIFNTWFAVPYVKYISEWQRVIDLARTSTRSNL
ncbi:hypothetical protein ABT346_13765 [Micromonospora peucetia]|uniref:hypothetical protein n=1 Tax=Micromonospora peucetia TaxID=47871 RepID=UPI00331B4423